MNWLFNTRLDTLFCCLAVSLIVSAPFDVSANSDNLIKDAGFEQQLSAAQGGWRMIENGRYSADQARSGKQSLFNWGFSRSVSYQPYLLGTATGSYQMFPATPGSRWRMTGYALTRDEIRGPAALGIVQLSFFDEEGNDLGTLETVDSKGAKARVSNQLNEKSPANEWVFLDTGIATAPVGATAIHAFTLFVDYSGSEVPQGVYFDDIMLCSLTEGNDGSTCR